MARGTFRGIASAWLGLIALDAIGRGGSGRIASFATDVNNALTRALDPSVPLVPDRRAGAGAVTAGAPYQRPADMPVPAPSGLPSPVPRAGIPVSQ